MSQFGPEGEAVDEGVEEPLTSTAAPEEEPEPQSPQSPEPEEEGEAPDLERLLAERTEDLQRLGAEYVNYKKRVDRDRRLARQAGIESVMNDLMPVLDSITLAREHGEGNDGLKLITDELEKVAGKYGLVAFGEVGEPFDPNLHDALMQVPLDEPVEVVTISQVMQQGYKLDDRVIRPARVGVANPS